MTYESTLFALNDSTRRALYERLLESPSSVGQLVQDLGVSQPAVSQHLKVLREAGLVTEERDGQKRIYRAQRQGIDDLQRYLQGLTGSHPAVDDAASSPLLTAPPDDIELAARRWALEWPGQDAATYSITTRLLQLGRHIERSLNETAARKDLQGSELLLLDALALAPGHILTPSQLQKRLNISKAGVTKLLNRMESIDLVSRLASSDDRRVSYVSLTPKAHGTLETILLHHEYGADHAAAKRLSAQEKQQLAQLLQRLHRLIDEELQRRANAEQ